MTEVLRTYDPNTARSMRTRHVFELTFQQWDHSKTLTVGVGGNCQGMHNLDVAVSQAYQQLPTKRYPVGGGVGSEPVDVAYITLNNPAGDSLECEEEDPGEDEWLMNMLVSARIVELKADPDG